MTTSLVLLLEDDPDLADLVRELLDESGYDVVCVTSVDELMRQAAILSPCVALLDSTDASGFNLWSLGPTLRRLGVPPVAFTAHATAKQQWERDPRAFVGVISKPFDADEFLETINTICWDKQEAAAS